MQYVFNDRRTYITTIEFRNSSPILNIERIRSFREEGIVGNFTKKEFRYSFDNNIWSPWKTLNQGNLTSIDFSDEQHFYLHVKYSRVKVIDGNIDTFYLTYDSKSITPPAPDPSALLNADLLQGEAGQFYLDLQNHVGALPSGAICVNNTGTGIGVFDSIDESSTCLTINLRNIKGAGDVSVYLSGNDIVIAVNDVALRSYVDGSLNDIRATYIPDASLNPEYFKWDSGYLEPSIMTGGAQGTTGSQGVQGPLGIQGLTGIQGVQGKIGAGIQGATGSQGIIGRTGSQGTIGPQGIIGSQGLTGVQGSLGRKGDKGDKGDDGIQGITGTQGLSGAQGRTGPRGPSGLDGAQGLSGSQGIQGVQGIIGQKGDKGDKGDTGAQGISGIQGVQGVQGNLGRRGPQGNDGLPGVQGAQGTGIQGAQGMIGCKGDDGAQGISGIQGVQGVQGNLGRRGPQGDDGLPGAQGTQGTGIQGVQGALGCKGDDGAQGIQGIQGVQGTAIQGAQGRIGPVGGIGIQGVQGTLGVQGTRGIQGERGCKGDDGEGTQGTQGTQGLGIQGIQGSLGIQGLAGEAAAQGIQGIQGSQGEGISDASYNELVIWQINQDVSIASIGAGEINYGQNVGSGDASIYYDKSGDALQFREIKAGAGVTISVSDNLIVIDVSGGSSPSGPSIDGGVWITNITPSGTGNVGDKIYSSDGAVLNSCLTDTSSLTVHVLALPGHTNYKPFVYIDGSTVTLSASDDKPIFTGTKNISYNFADASVTVVHEDGANWSTIVDADTPAVIQSAVFIGGYPGVQTELKAGDTFDVSIMTDVSIVSVIVDNYGAFSGGTFAVSGNNVRITATIADRGDSTQALGFRLRVVKSTGSTSANYLSADHGIIDGTHLVNLNDIYPTITWGTITYPGSQKAIKSTESAAIVNTVTQYDTLTYSSPNGELTVTSPTTYQSPKTVTYLSGGYNIATNNLRIVANRAANNATSTSNMVIWIANTPATLSVGGYSARLRSGGNDETSAQSHTITITSSQRLLNAPTLVKDTGGTWLGTEFSWSASATAFTRSLQVHDNDTKGTYNWGAISGTNLAGIVTSTNSGSTQYILGGFVVRTISVAAFGWQSNINVAVSDYSKLSSSGTGQVLAWSVSNMNTRSTLGDVTRPQASVWSASATGTNPTTINILDKSATDSTSKASSFTIQEGI